MDRKLYMRSYMRKYRSLPKIGLTITNNGLVIGRLNIRAIPVILLGKD